MFIIFINTLFYNSVLCNIILLYYFFTKKKHEPFKKPLRYIKIDANILMYIDAYLYVYKLYIYKVHVHAYTLLCI